MAKADLRVYVPLTAALLRRARDEGELGPAPLNGHAVTPLLVQELASDLAGAAEPDAEECEYAALTAAALDSLLMLGVDDPPLRLVAAVDVSAWEPRAAAEEGVSAVSIAYPVPLRRLAALLVDAPDAAADVSAAREALLEAAGEDDALTHQAVQRCFDRDLGWFAAQELDDVLDHLALGSPGGRATIA